MSAFSYFYYSRSPLSLDTADYNKIIIAHSNPVWAQTMIYSSLPLAFRSAGS